MAGSLKPSFGAIVQRARDNVLKDFPSERLKYVQEGDFQRALETLDRLVMLCGREGDSFYDFEETATAFQRDTGKLMPGKDAPAPEMAATRDEYLAWRRAKIEFAKKLLARLCPEPEDMP